MSRFASGKFAKAVCDICGFTCKYTSLKAIVSSGKPTATLACKTCWSVENPQDNPARYIVGPDAEALRNPRPDSGLM